MPFVVLGSLAANQLAVPFEDGCRPKEVDDCLELLPCSPSRLFEFVCQNGQGQFLSSRWSDRFLLLSRQEIRLVCEDHDFQVFRLIAQTADPNDVDEC